MSNQCVGSPDIVNVLVPKNILDKVSIFLEPYSNITLFYFDRNRLIDNRYIKNKRLVLAVHVRGKGLCRKEDAIPKFFQLTDNVICETDIRES